LGRRRAFGRFVAFAVAKSMISAEVLATVVGFVVVIGTTGTTMRAEEVLVKLDTTLVPSDQGRYTDMSEVSSRPGYTE